MLSKFLFFSKSSLWTLFFSANHRLWNAYITSVGSIALIQNVEQTVVANWSGCQANIRTPSKILEVKDSKKGFGCPGKWLKSKFLGKHPWQSATSKNVRDLVPQAPFIGDPDGINVQVVNSPVVGGLGKIYVVFLLCWG